MTSDTSSGVSPEGISCPEWGLKRDIAPCFGARLVQEGNRLHYWLTVQGLAGRSPTML